MATEKLKTTWVRNKTWTNQ